MRQYNCCWSFGATSRLVPSRHQIPNDFPQFFFLSVPNVPHVGLFCLIRNHSLPPFCGWVVPTVCAGEASNPKRILNGVARDLDNTRACACWAETCAESGKSCMTYPPLDTVEIESTRGDNNPQRECGT